MSLAWELFWYAVLFALTGVAAFAGAFMQSLRAGDGTATFWEWLRTLWVVLFVLFALAVMLIRAGGKLIGAGE